MRPARHLRSGQTDREAERPLVIKAGNVTVGVVGLAKPYGSHVTAGRARAGTIVFSQASIDRGYKLAKDAGADYVVADVHWGENYQVLNAEQRHLAATLADAGYDLVIGSGPHVVHPVEVIGKTIVFYSLGNFVFGTNGRFTADLKGSASSSRRRSRKTVSGRSSCHVHQTDNDKVHFQPRPAPRGGGGEGLREPRRPPHGERRDRDAESGRRPGGGGAVSAANRDRLHLVAEAPEVEQVPFDLLVPHGSAEKPPLVVVHGVSAGAQAYFDAFGVLAMRHQRVLARTVVRAAALQGIPTTRWQRG